jgi:hypothetical protein
MQFVLLPVTSASSKNHYHQSIGGWCESENCFRERTGSPKRSPSGVSMQENECRRETVWIVRMDSISWSLDPAERCDDFVVRLRAIRVHSSSTSYQPTRLARTQGIVPPSREADTANTGTTSRTLHAIGPVLGGAPTGA